MPHYLLFSRDISLLSLVFQCYMDYNNFFFFSHYTPHLQALWKVPSAQCHLTCNKLTNKLTNKPLQKMSEMEKLAKSLEQADLIGEFKFHEQNRVFYFTQIIIQKTQLLVARHFRWCAIIDNTNFMTCTRPHPNYNTNLPLDGVKKETGNEDPPKTSTPTRLDPLSRAPTPETTPLIEPNPTPTLVSDPAPLQNHTHQHSTPGPEPSRLWKTSSTVHAWTPPAVWFLSPPEQVLRTKETGPRCRSRLGRHGGIRIERRGSRSGRSDRPKLKDVRTKTKGSWMMRNPIQWMSQKVSQAALTNQPITTLTTTTHPPTHPPTNPTHTSLRSPGEVYGEVNPRFTVTVSRPGAGDEAQTQILRALLFSPEDYSVGRITQVTDGVSFGVEEDNSLRVVREVLEADGWGLNITPVWNRYWLYIPTKYQNLPLDDLILGFNLRNSRRVRGPEGLPENSIRAAGVMEEAGENGQPRRVRAWVDISPEGEEYLRANDFLLRIVSSAVRLRPATSNHSVPDRS